jgi:hypothetical protein
MADNLFIFYNGEYISTFFLHSTLYLCQTEYIIGIKPNNN